MKIQITNRAIWGISAPLILAGISENIVDLTDTIFLAHYGLVELGAIGIADAIFEISIFLAVGLAEGVQILVSRRAGEGREAEIGRVFNQALYLTIALTLLMMAILYPALPWLTDAMVTSDQVGSAIDEFLSVYLFAIGFHVINLVYGGLYVGIGRTRVLMGAMLVLGGTNLVLNYALIFGNLGMPELGIRGAAWGSLIAEIAAFALLTGYALVRLPIDRYRLFRLEGLDRVLTGLIMRLSTPVGLDALLETGRWLCLFLIIERMGETPLAAANIVFACLSVLLIPILGFSEAACTMVSNLIGQGRSAELYPLLKKVTGMAAMLVAPLLLVAALVPEGLLAIFSEDPSVVTASVPSLRVVAVAVVVILLAEMMVSAISGTGDTGVTFAIGGIYTLVTLVYAYFAGVVYDLGLAWVWSAEIAGWLLVLAIAAFWLRMGYWRRLEI